MFQLSSPSFIDPKRLLTLVSAENLRISLTRYIQHAWHVADPALLQWNWHIDAIAEHLTALSQREIRFLSIQIPPRMSKTLLACVLYPTWHWINWPEEQFICASYNADLAVSQALLARRVIESMWYQERWGSVYSLRQDQNSADMYSNNKGGYRVAVSVGGKTTGMGGTIQIGDDFHNAKAVESDVKRRSDIEWHDNAWRSRVNDPNTARKLYIGQRTHDEDIYGHTMKREGERWVNLILPMEYNPERKCITYANDGTGPNKKKKLFEDPRKVDGELLNPVRFNKYTAAAEKDAMSVRAWNAQMQQQPEGSGGLILKRKWWRPWVYPENHKLASKEMPMPVFFEIIQVYDTAFETDEQNDYTARSTWGLFTPSDEELTLLGGNVVPIKRKHDPEDEDRVSRQRPQGKVCAMLLDKLYERLEYPDLRREMLRSDNEFKADKILVEKKASGHSLLQEGRRKKLPMVAVKVQGDLVSRVNAASLMLEKGCIFYPPRKWAYEVIETAAKFPVGDHDDMESTLSMAWQYMRQYHGLQLPDDEDTDEISPFKWQRKTYA